MKRFAKVFYDVSVRFFLVFLICAPWVFYLLSDDKKSVPIKFMILVVCSLLSLWFFKLTMKIFENPDFELKLNKGLGGKRKDSF